MQGDIIGVYNSTGKKIGAYTYDAWGKCSLSVANGNTILENEVMHHYNPFRYRGYYYDYETGFYYLQSRYYNPEWGRFINADGYINANGDILGFNMFAYCGNNPVMNIDPNGDMILPPIFKKQLAVTLLMYWIFGNGDTLSFDDSSFAADVFRNSPGMNAICNEALEKFKQTGQSHYASSASITGFKDFDVWMAARKFVYTIDITEKKYSTGLLWWKKTETEYILTIKINDTYNFDSATDKGDGIGSWLNNEAYKLHQRGYGKNYEWNLTYTKRYNSPSQKNRGILNLLFFAI